MTESEKYQKIADKLNELFPNPKPELNYSTPWEFCVAVILSARNTDKKVNQVTDHLFQKYKNLPDYINTELEEFEQDISQIGLFRQKAKSIKKTAEIISKKYNGKIPDTMEELTALPGVGRKTANVLLSEIYKKNEGIVVDTHVARLSRLFGLTDQKTPEKIEQDLMKIVPKHNWRKFSLQLILYGRYYFKANSKKDHPLAEFIQE